jgi:hypothetical protein
MMLRSSENRRCLESYARCGIERRAQSVVNGGELRNCEEGGQRVAHQPAPGAEVVVGEWGRRSVPEEDLLIGFRKVGG